MYLKSIEVQGFKSFAHKIKFDFHNGITGIVGPNGSGKSNVADAVRWVLGEQRVKQLRGGSMQDVIFSGTENRKPLSYASVAITLDNSDHSLPIEYQEVTVTRKLYRSGESEYLINGSACRLKDINELFYDTGIGKEGYSIIGQGQIERILSGKPEERRELFDEAAGIVKFKRRKNLSVKKLEEERQNLLRVNDILSELEKQVGPLEKQSQVAREYLKKKEELKRFDINMFLLETDRLKEQIADLDEKIKLSSGEMAASRQKFEERKNEYEAIEDEIEEINQEIEKAKHQLNETTLLKQQLEGQINVLNEQINTARTNDEHYSNRVSIIQAELAARSLKKKDFETEQERLMGELQEKHALDQKANEELLRIQQEILKFTNVLETAQNDLVELLNNRASTSAKIQYFDSTREQFELQQTQIREQIKAAKEEMESQASRRESFAENLKEITEKITAQQEIVAENEKKISGYQKELDQKQDAFLNSQREYHREASRLESLKNMTERYDGYGNSIRRVMSQKERVPGLLGVVADIIKTDRKYELAMETALGGSIQNIVTDAEDTAKKMISYLKQNKFGRATFLPLTTVKNYGGFPKPEALKEEGVIGTADRLAKTDPRFQEIASSLLGRTLVVDHIDHGTRIARKYRQSLRIVTLEGDLINPGGSMTGGAFKNSSNLLSRRREVEELEKKTGTLKLAMEDLSAQVEELKALRAGCYAKNDELQQILQKDYVVQNTARMNSEQIERRIREIQRSVEQNELQLAKLDEKLLGVEENKTSIHLELETSNRMEAELNHRIEEAQKELEESRAQEQEKQKASEAVHLAHASIEQQSQFIMENIERLDQESLKFQKELEELDQNQSGASEEIRQKEAEIEDIRRTINDSAELFEEIEQEIEDQTKRREELTLKHKRFLSQREELSQRIADLDKEVFRLTSRKEGYEEASEKQINYMWEEYEITYNYALSVRDETLTDLSFMKKQIQSLKQEIRALGNVNVNAIEEYKSVSERYEFLKEQHDDLIEAEESLVKIIEELDEAMRKQFMEQFARISKEFDHVFRQLFGGGKGTLELMEDADILEAGVRIIAQPPGKKLQNMMQLSGGEKALTAISLLFAIQNLKPSPFCLLDEIEAALDDSNVTRFAQYLHKLTKNTQFIVITHRRGTMNAADRLYGITMQEKGVSTLVSVDLLEGELETQEEVRNEGK